MTATGLRAIVRIARRSIGRSRWRSLLVSVLVMLPVAAMVAASMVLQTIEPTPEQSVTRQMGAADLIVYPGLSGANTDALRVRLPSGSRVEPILVTDGHLVLPGRVTAVTLRSLDLDGLARGMMRVVDGRPPRDTDEVAVSSAIASLAAVRIGGTVTLDGLGSRRIVGLVEDPFDIRARVVLEDGSAAVAASAEGQAIWLVGLPPGWASRTLAVPPVASGPNGGDFQVVSRSDATFAAGAPTPVIVVLGGLALVEAALVASAAFAVSVRRRQRELGLLAATGATPRQLAGTVIAEAALLGGLGVVLGVGVGIVGAVATTPWLDQLTDRRNPAMSLALGATVLAAAIGLVAALIAALAPAWTAARQPVLTALSGRRPASTPARRTLALGILIIGVAVALTSSGAALRLADTDGSKSTMSLLLMLAGAVLGTLGFGACSPWLLERLERPAARLPLAPRIALRDTARARSRNGPIVTALLASFAATVALAAYLASQDAIAAAHWQPTLLPDQVFVQGEGAARDGPQAARDLGALAAGPILGIGNDTRTVWISPGTSDDPNQGIPYVTVGDAELLRALGAETAAADLSNGAVVLLVERATDLTSVTVHIVDASGAEIGAHSLPARVVVTGVAGGELPGAILSAATATRLGVPAGVANGANDRYVIRLSHPVTDAELARAAAIAAQDPNTWADASLGPARPGDGFRLAMVIASLLFGLTTTGVAVALGEAESRPDQRVLLALGADPGVRRRIAAARAGVLTVLAGILAVPAGLLPVWGLLSSRGSALAVPVPEILAALVLLPVLSVVGALTLSRPIPVWSAFRGPAS